MKFTQLLSNLLAICLICLVSNVANATVHTILADNFFYSPSSLTITQGDTVQFMWVAGDHPTNSTGGPWSTILDEEPLNNSNPSFQVTFDNPGMHNYICDDHDDLGMVGSILVEENCAPSTVPGAFTSVVTGTAVQFSWNPVRTSVGCQVSGGPFGAGFPASQNLPGFELNGVTIPTAALAGGVYEAQVRCACSLSPLVLTQNSISSTFILPEPKLATNDQLFENALLIKPNPIADRATVEFNVEVAGEVSIQVNDAMGRLVMQTSFEAFTGKQTYEIDLTEVPAGNYFLSVSIGSQEFNQQIQVAD